MRKHTIFGCSGAFEPQRNAAFGLSGYEQACDERSYGTPTCTTCGNEREGDGSCSHCDAEQAAAHARLSVVLSHAANPDIDGGGYWPGSPGRHARAATIAVASLRAASEACRTYITENALGGGNWTGGLITDGTGEPIGYVSYNGRVWALRAGHGGAADTTLWVQGKPWSTFGQEMDG